MQPRRQHWFLNEKSGFPIPNGGLLLEFPGGEDVFGEKEYRAPSVTPGLHFASELREGFNDNHFGTPLHDARCRGRRPHHHSIAEREIASPPEAEVQMRGNARHSAVRSRAFGDAQLRKIVADTNCLGMLGAERLLADREGPLVERSGAGEVALVLKQAAENVKALCGPTMVAAALLLPDIKRPLEEPARALEVALVPKHAGRGC